MLDSTEAEFRSEYYLQPLPPALSVGMRTCLHRRSRGLFTVTVELDREHVCPPPNASTLDMLEMLLGKEVFTLIPQYQFES